MARDDRGVTDPGVIRDRFLSEFALALVEGVQLQEFLDWSVAQIGRILDVDRLTLFLFGAGGAADALVVRASWAADGIDPIPVTIPLSESMVSARLKQFESVVVEDVEDAADLEEGREILRRLGTKSLLAVPIGIDSALRGFVAAASVRERRDWTPEDVAFLESAVHHLSAALKQTELVEELGRERDRLSVLFDLASAVQRSTTVNDVVETALSGLRDTLLFPIGVFSLVAPEGDAVIGLGGYGGADAGDFSGRTPLTPERPTVSFRVLESGQPLIVNDVEEEPEGPSKERFRQLGARSFGVFPMRSAGKTIGVMSVASRDSSRRIEFDDVETLQSLADFVGVALEQRRAADAVAEAMREARSLADASHALLTRTADRRILLDQILDALAQHFGHEACSLLLVDQERHVLVQNGRRGLWWSPVDPVSVIPLDAAGLIPLAARSGRVVNVPDVASEPDYVVGWPDARSELVVPLILDDRVVGVFDLQSGHPNAFSDADARTIRAFAERAALGAAPFRARRHAGEPHARSRGRHARHAAPQLPPPRAGRSDVGRRGDHARVPGRRRLRRLGERHGRHEPVRRRRRRRGRDDAARGRDRVASAAAPEVRGPGLPREPSRVSPGVGIRRAFRRLGPGHARPRPRRRRESGRALPHGRADPRRRSPARRPRGPRESRRDAFTSGDGETLALLAEQSAIALRNARLIEELQRSNRLKDDFLANLSHEIRTPLTGIVGWAEVLLDSRRDDADARRALEAILGQADTLTRMLADLIDLSRIDNFGLELRRSPVAIPEILAAALDAVSPGARRRGVVIRCTLDPDLPSVEGDAARLKQVLWNLLSNGVKFSPAGGTVHVDRAPRSGGGLEIAVEDEGHGIDPEFLPLVFDRFRQEETSSNRRFGGLGHRPRRSRGRSSWRTAERSSPRARGASAAAASGSRSRPSASARIAAPSARGRRARGRRDGSPVDPRETPRSSGDAPPEAEERIAALNRIGIALSAERDVDTLLEKILDRVARASRTPKRAASTSWRTAPEGRRLRFKLAQNDAVSFAFSERTVPVDEASLAGCVAVHGEPLVLEDAYAASDGRPVPAQRRVRRRDRVPDARHPRRPDEDHRGELVGVLQLMNRKGARDGSARAVSGRPRPARPLARDAGGGLPEGEPADGLDPEALRGLRAGGDRRRRAAGPDDGRAQQPRRRRFTDDARRASSTAPRTAPTPPSLLEGRAARDQDGGAPPRLREDRHSRARPRQGEEARRRTSFSGSATASTSPSRRRRPSEYRRLLERAARGRRTPHARGDSSRSSRAARARAAELEELFEEVRRANEPTVLPDDAGGTAARAPARAYRTTVAAARRRSFSRRSSASSRSGREASRRGADDDRDATSRRRGAFSRRSRGRRTSPASPTSRTATTRSWTGPATRGCSARPRSRSRRAP